MAKPPTGEAGVSQKAETLKVKSDVPGMQPILAAPSAIDPYKESRQTRDFQCGPKGFHSKLLRLSDRRMPSPFRIFKNTSDMKIFQKKKIVSIVSH